jgi:hypothetical protein
MERAQQEDCGARGYHRGRFGASAVRHRSNYEFPATDASDPRRNFISTLCGALAEGGSIVVYSQQFESQRLSELAAFLPEFAERIESIQSRLWDLLPVIRNHVYHPAFAGSISLEVGAACTCPRVDLRRHDCCEWAGRGAGSLDEANEILGLMMRHWNTIAGTLFKGEVYVPLLLEDENGTAHGNDWARGFMRGMGMRHDGWAELVNDEEHGGCMVPVFILYHEHS